MTPLARLALTFTAGSAVACASREPIPLPDPAQVGVIGSGGGRLDSPDGRLALVFSAGALARDTTVSITEEATPRVAGQHGPSYRLDPAGTRPGAPITLSIDLGATFEPDDGVVPTLVRIASGAALPVMGASYDAAEHEVRASIDLLTSYAVVVAPPRSGCDVADGGMPYTRDVIYPCWITEREPNDTQATAQDLGLGLDEGVDLLGFIDGADDHYVFEVPAGATGAVDGMVHSILGNYGSCDPGLEVEGELLDARGAVLSRGWHNGGCVGFNYRDDPGARDLPPGRYTIHVSRGPRGQSLPYRFALYLLGPANGTVTIGPDGGI